MSHEIRTPMNAIVGFADLLGCRPDELDHTEYVDHIRDATQHLLTIVNDVLDCSKIEAGRLGLVETEMRSAELFLRARADPGRCAEEVAAVPRRSRPGDPAGAARRPHPHRPAADQLRQQRDQVHAGRQRDHAREAAGAGPGGDPRRVPPRWLDVEMPEMDGCEATRTIRQLPEGDRVPIIALSDDPTA